MVNLNTTTTNNTLPHQKEIEGSKAELIFYSNFKEKGNRALNHCLHLTPIVKN